MLKQVRGAMKNILAWFVIVLLVLAFAAWGVPEIRQFTRSYALRVGDEGFAAADVQKEFDRFVTNRRNQSGEDFSREDAIAAGLHNQIVQSLATRSALEQEADRLGLVMTREMAKDYLQTSEQFKNPSSGKFDAAALENILREYNFSIREFEETIRSELLRNQLMGGLAAGGPASRAVIDPLIMREIETRQISYLTISEDMAGAPAAATPEALKDYYDKNATQFLAPEYRTFTVVTLKNDAFEEAEDGASDAQLLEVYNANKSRYETPEKRTLYQIVYQDKAVADAAVAGLKSGKPFEAIASDNGQTLAEVTLTDVAKSDILDPKVQAGVFDAGAAAGAIVGPIEGVFGHTVVQVASVTPGTVKSFEEARAELAEQFDSQNTRKKLFEAIELVENERDTGTPLGDAARKHGYAAMDFGPIDNFSFGPGGEIVTGIDREALEAAFKLEEGEESEATEFEDGSGYFFISMKEVTPATPMPFEKVRSEVETRWRAGEREARLAAVVKTVNDAVKAGKSLKDAAAPFNRAPITETVNRRAVSENLSEALLDQIFSAPKGGAVSGPTNAGDAQIVVVIDDIIFDESRVADADLGAFAQFVGQQIDQELAEAYANSVRADVGVKIRQAEIDALFSGTQ